LRTDKLGRMMTICGTVTRTTEVKPELLEGTYQFNECNREITGVEQQFKVTPPAVSHEKLWKSNQLDSPPRQPHNPMG